MLAFAKVQSKESTKNAQKFGHDIFFVKNPNRAHKEDNLSMEASPTSSQPYLNSPLLILQSSIYTQGPNEVAQPHDVALVMVKGEVRGGAGGMFEK